eukprot:3507505-Amphidinium_carterae.1
MFLYCWISAVANACFNENVSKANAPKPLTVNLGLVHYQSFPPCFACSEAYSKQKWELTCSVQDSTRFVLVPGSSSEHTKK